MHGNPAELLIGGLRLSGMQARPDRNTQLGDCRDDRVGCPNRLGRLIKGGKEAVSGGIELSAMEPAELSANRSVMGRHQSLPGLVTEPDGKLGGPHDVGEEDCREQPLWLTGGIKTRALSLGVSIPATTMATADVVRVG